MDIRVSEQQFARYDTVGVYLPNKPFRENYRLPRPYARQLRDLNLANFINRADDIRLTFTPDPTKIVAGAQPLPGTSMGLNHRKLENGVSVRPPKRTKTRCIRPKTYSLTQCKDVNHGDQVAL